MTGERPIGEDDLQAFVDGRLPSAAIRGDQGLSGGPAVPCRTGGARDRAARGPAREAGLQGAGARSLAPAGRQHPRVPAPCADGSSSRCRGNRLARDRRRSGRFRGRVVGFRVARAGRDGECRRHGHRRPPHLCERAAASGRGGRRSGSPSRAMAVAPGRQAARGAEPQSPGLPAHRRAAPARGQRGCGALHVRECRRRPPDALYALGRKSNRTRHSGSKRRMASPPSPGSTTGLSYVVTAKVDRGELLPIAETIYKQFEATNDAAKSRS